MYLNTIAASLILAAAALSVNAAPSGIKGDILLPPNFVKFNQHGFPLNSKGTELHLIQTDSDKAPVWMTEESVWELKRNNVHFMDVTFQPNLAEKAEETRLRNQKQDSTASFSASSTSLIDEARPIIASANTNLMKQVLTNLSSYYNRYYRSTTGTQSANWLFSQVQSIASRAKPGVTVTVTQFKHSYPQSSIIARIEGDSSQQETVIIGAHQDSVNSSNANGRAPGADDDGSGTVSALEAFRALIDAGFQPKRPIEFHWYAAEEAGLLGSQDIAASYQKAGRRVAGMLQLDMTGTPASSRPNEIGFISDNVDLTLTSRLEELVGIVLPGVTSKRFRCGYGCSDHASWTKAGYPAAFPFESGGLNNNRYIHTVNDTIDKVNFEHALRFTKLAIAYAVQLSKE